MLSNPLPNPTPHSALSLGARGGRVDAAELCGHREGFRMAVESWEGCRSKTVPNGSKAGASRRRLAVGRRHLCSGVWMTCA